LRDLFAPRRFISNKSVLRTRAPEAPMYGRIMMAPLFTFTMDPSPFLIHGAGLGGAKSPLVFDQIEIGGGPAFANALYDA
jgi:hypothetical protein